MKRRVVAWAVSYGTSVDSVFDTRAEAVTWCDCTFSGRTMRARHDVRIIKLIEADPRVDAIVRAALNYWTEEGQYTFGAPLAEKHLGECIERYLKRRK